MRSPYSIALAFSLAALCTLSTAQEKPALKAEILTLCSTGVIRNLQFTNRGKVETTTIYSRGFGIPIAYEGDARLVLFRTTQPKPGFEPVRTVVGQVDLPTDAGSILLLVDPKKSETESYQVLALNNDRSQFPPGAFRFFNSSEEELLFQMEQETFRLRPKEQHIEKPTGDENGNVELRIFSILTSAPRKIYSSVWHVSAKRRSNVFVTQSAATNQEIEIRKILEPIVEKKK